MKATYNSPNRSHHYRYASALARAGCLHAFVSGYSRFSPHAALPGLPVVRADEVQNVYQAALRLRAPARVSEELAYLSKLWLDRKSTRPARESDLFVCYSGAGLRTLKELKGSGTLGVVEAVNSHVLVQQRIMREEFERLGLPLTGFPPREVARRVREYELADAILCPSQFVKQSFVDEGIRGRSAFMSFPMASRMPETTAASPRAVADGTFRVLYVGQLAPRKGVRYLLEAFALLKHPRKELVIVGPRSQPSGLEDATIPANVRFAGVLKGEALAQAYDNATVFVLPTLEEGLALVLGEALAHGTPVIATLNSGGEDLFQDGEEGFLTPVRDPLALAEKMQLLADEPARRERMSHAARARMQALGGWEATERLLVETLREIAVGRSTEMKFTPATT